LPVHSIEWIGSSTCTIVYAVSDVNEAERK